MRPRNMSTVVNEIGIFTHADINCIRRTLLPPPRPVQYPRFYKTALLVPRDTVKYKLMNYIHRRAGKSEIREYAYPEHFTPEDKSQFPQVPAPDVHTHTHIIYFLSIY